MVLCQMTAAELVAFRDCCTEYKTFFEINESAIVRGTLENPFYYTASTLYSVLRPTGPLELGNLINIAHRCEIAEMLASSIAERHVGQGSAVTTRMAKNVMPYVLSIGHFFEEFGSALGDLTPTHSAPWLPSPGITLEGEILTRNYNDQTVQRMCLTYKLSKEILEPKFLGREFPIVRLWIRPRDNVSGPAAATIDMFTFGSLEMIKDIGYFVKRMSTLVPAVGPQAPAALPPSGWGPWWTLDKILRSCSLLPPARGILDVRHIEKTELPKVDSDEKEVAMDLEFLEYLKSYDGEMPKVVR
ncbi:MAG: hypothetical protein Q9161_001011 [Pseudevernia consocians]